MMFSPSACPAHPRLCARAPAPLALALTFRHAACPARLSRAAPAARRRRYITMMVSNRKTRDELVAELRAFLDERAAPFGDWLWRSLARRAAAGGGADVGGASSRRRERRRGGADDAADERRRNDRERERLERVSREPTGTLPARGGAPRPDADAAEPRRPPPPLPAASPAAANTTFTVTLEGRSALQQPGGARPAGAITQPLPLALGAPPNPFAALAGLAPLPLAAADGGQQAPFAVAGAAGGLSDLFVAMSANAMAGGSGAGSRGRGGGGRGGGGRGSGGRGANPFDVLAALGDAEDGGGYGGYGGYGGGHGYGRGGRGRGQAGGAGGGHAGGGGNYAMGYAGGGYAPAPGPLRSRHASRRQHAQQYGRGGTEPPWPPPPPRAARFSPYGQAAGWRQPLHSNVWVRPELLVAAALRSGRGPAHAPARPLAPQPERARGWNVWVAPHARTAAEHAAAAAAAVDGASSGGGDFGGAADGAQQPLGSQAAAAAFNTGVTSTGLALPSASSGAFGVFGFVPAAQAHPPPDAQLAGPAVKLEPPAQQPAQHGVAAGAHGFGGSALVGTGAAMASPAGEVEDASEDVRMSDA
jgi:hypothetical protein